MASAVASTSTCVWSPPPTRRCRAPTLRVAASDDDSDFVPAKASEEDEDDDDDFIDDNDEVDDQGSPQSLVGIKLDSDDESVARSMPGARKKRYLCTWPGCGKVYSRPVRLQEHQRRHTGERPFACSECDATFARDSHLKAHTRIHASESDKPFACSEEGCDKRFWTKQHLKAHVDGTHLGLAGSQTYGCAECGKIFRKHRLLNEHRAVAHDLPTVKPLACSHPGCDKTFKQKHHLRSHEKTHDLSRYACLHPDCAHKPFDERQFGVWSALQKHTKLAHPPRCHYPQCAGKLFTTSYGLRTHLKLHAADEEAGSSGLPEGRQRRPRKRTRTRGGRSRTGAESKESGMLQGETMIKGETEAGLKAEEAEGWNSGDEAASDWEDRQEAERDERMREHFRHAGKKKRKLLEDARGFPPILSRPSAAEKAAPSSSSRDNWPTPSSPPSQPPAAPVSTFYRDLVTGASYSHAANPSAKPSRKSRARSAPPSQTSRAFPTKTADGDDRPRPGLTHVPRQYACPFPAILALPFKDVKLVLPGESDADDAAEGTCRFWFKRVYDVERHLRSRHGVEIVGGRETLDTWFDAQRDEGEGML